MLKRFYTLDACGLIAFLNGEEGSEKVERILMEASEDASAIYMHTVNLYEVFYDFRKTGGGDGKDFLDRLGHLPILFVDRMDSAIMIPASDFKIRYKVSLADSIALGLASFTQSSLLTSDHHEMEPIARDNALLIDWIR
jgi:PIN domain nuclease of toxin-antitoxin system